MEFDINFFREKGKEGGKKVLEMYGKEYYSQMGKRSAKKRCKKKTATS
jgi:hypothetical protein